MVFTKLSFNRLNRKEMLDKIENLKAQMKGHDLNIYQKADALIEFNKLLEYTEQLEAKVKELSLVGVSGRQIKHQLEYSI